jgi:hypothetical protein
MIHLVPVVILSFMHIPCTNTMFHISQASRDGSFFWSKPMNPADGFIGNRLARGWMTIIVNSQVNTENNSVRDKT